MCKLLTMPTRISKAISSEKIISILTAITATILCSWQLTLCFQQYFDHPTTISVQIGGRKTFKMPTFTVCPTWISKECPHFIKDLNLFDPICSQLLTEFKDAFNTECSTTQLCAKHDISTIPLQKLNVSLNALWLEYQIKTNISHLNYKCDYSVNGVQCQQENWFIQNYSPRPTYYGGKCLIVSQIQELYYTPNRRFIPLLLYDFKSNVLTTSFGEGTYSYDSLLHAGLILQYHTTYVLSNIREFYSLHTQQRPCISDEGAIACRERCIDEDIETLNLCRLPMLDPIRHPRLCETLGEVQSNHDKFQRWLQRRETFCKCPRKCNDTFMDIKNVVVSSLRPAGIEVLIDVNNKVEVIREKYAYTLFGLLTDIVGNLGFYFGISLIVTTEQIIKFLKKCFAKQ